jgi:hypothetical protein
MTMKLFLAAAPIAISRAANQPLPVVEPMQT